MCCLVDCQMSNFLHIQIIPSTQTFIHIIFSCFYIFVSGSAFHTKGGLKWTNGEQISTSSLFLYCGACSGWSYTYLQLHRTVLEELDVRLSLNLHKELSRLVNTTEINDVESNIFFSFFLSLTMWNVT